MQHLKATGFLVQMLTVSATLAFLVTGCAPQPTRRSLTDTPAGLANQPTGSSTVSQPPIVPRIRSEPPSLIFFNGTILTMDKEQPAAEAIAIAGERVVAVGSNDQVLALQVSGTELVDLKGSTLMPGFVDPHTHIFNDARFLMDPVDYEKVQQLALQNGITTLADMFVNQGFLAEMQALNNSGNLKVRLSLYLVHTNNCGEVLADWYKQVLPTRTPGEMLRIAGVKLFADGGSCGKPATSFEGPGVGFGDLFQTQEEMNALVSEIDQAGYQVAIHAIGDRAVEQALNAIEFALTGRPNTLRHRIEHNRIVRPDLIPRYQEVGVVATIFGALNRCDLEADLPEYQSWSYPNRQLLDANPQVHFAWHSDYPWVGPAAPLLHLYSMVTPYEIINDTSTECPDPSWLTGKTLRVEEVLPMMTIEGAYALFRENEVGSLEAGKYADLIILSGNPLADINAIKNLKVWMTMVGGQVEWCAPGQEVLCPVANDLLPVQVSFPLRIRIQTTSDWTTFGLLGGGSLDSPRLVSASKEATFNWLEANRFLLMQPLEPAQLGQQVEMVVDALLNNLGPDAVLHFEVERGGLGSTQVEMYNTLGPVPILVDTIQWGGTSPGDRNVYSVDLPAAGYLVKSP
jgi:predicted amidohydrolase YtcJ